MTEQVRLRESPAVMGEGGEEVREMAARSSTVKKKNFYFLLYVTMQRF